MGVLSWIRDTEVPEERTNVQRVCDCSAEAHYKSNSLCTASLLANTGAPPSKDSGWGIHPLAGVLWHLTQTQAEAHAPQPVAAQPVSEHTDTLSRNGFGALQCTGKLWHTRGEHPLEVRWMSHRVRDLEWIFPAFGNPGCPCLYFIKT